MDCDAKVKVTSEEFTARLNECLHRDPANEGMGFRHDKDGFELLAPGLLDTGRMALSKAIFDEVSQRYTVASE